MEKAKADENNLTCKVIGEKISTFLLCSLAIRHQENKNDVQPVDRNRAYLNADETTVAWTIYEPSNYTFRFDKEMLIKTISHLKKMLLHEKSLQEWETIEYTPCTCVADFLKSA